MRRIKFNVKKKLLAILAKSKKERLLKRINNNKEINLQNKKQRLI